MILCLLRVSSRELILIVDIIININMLQQEFYLKTQFQNKLQLAAYYSTLPAPEEQPYDNKYIAIKLLKDLKPNPYTFIPEAMLGELYADVDQNSDSIRSYQNSLELFSKLEGVDISNYYNVLINVYNILGLSYINRDQNQQGVGLLGKAFILYEAYKDIKHDDVYHNRTRPEPGLNFKYFYEGGINSKRMQESHTLTLFYLAQAYTKLGFKDKAAEYCGKTLQRQFTNKTYELKQYCLNLISLSDYYINNKLFAQAEYLLLAGLSLLPEGGKKKLHATFYMSLGNMLGELLNFCCVSIRNQQANEPNADEIISRKVFEFQGIDLKFPKLTFAKDLEQCKSLFRQANTQYKKALETYVLDGFVTEHIQILFGQSKLYKTLCIVEDSKERRAGMMQKRRQLMQPILKQLNPKAYQNTWQRVLVELAQICNQLFDTRSRILVEAKQPSLKKISDVNDCGLKSIEYYSTIQQTLLQSKDVQKTSTYYQSIINSKFNVAKTYSKLISPDNKVRVSYLKQSLERYTNLKKYINEIRTTTSFKRDFQKEEELTKEMLEMLPSKIDRVNYGMANMFD